MSFLKVEYFIHYFINLFRFLRQTMSKDNMDQHVNVCEWLQMVANLCERLQMAANSCKGPRMVANVCKWLQIAANGCKWLQIVKTSQHSAFFTQIG
ncbi:hypothetical protein BK125_23910 [Paenibacillus odorifer]|nr:hypothetical protein BK125_23910 [Paenibacillus odorifer]